MPSVMRLNMKKILTYIIISLIMLHGVTASALEITSKGACVINAETGETYYALNEN